MALQEIQDTLGLCHLSFKEAYPHDETAPLNKGLHLRSALVLVGVFEVGWIWGLLVIDRQRSSAEPPNDGRLVFFPNPVGSLKLEFHLVYLALRAGVS